MPNTIPADDRPRLIGGPRDGSRIAKATRPVFIWVGGDLKKPRVWVEPGGRRDLYRYLERRDGIDVFLYAGDTHRLCPGCCVYASLARCAFCGTSLRDDAPHVHDVS